MGVHMRWVGLTLLLWLMAPTVIAHEAVLEPTRLTVHGEIVPRLASTPGTHLIVTDATTVFVPADATFDAIEVQAGGALRCDGSVRVTQLLVLPGGTLVTSPGCEIIIRNTPIAGDDPNQWGTGLLNFGHWSAAGEWVTPFVALASDPGAGATSLSLGTAPVGWQVGDTLLLPDTRQTGWTGSIEDAPRFETTTIAGLSGSTVSLASALGFARDAIRDPDGGIVVRGRVVNLSRRIVVRSENPAGTRGHVAMVGTSASWDLVGVEFRNLGRTRNVPLGSTNIGGRYPLHFHHAGDASGSRLSGVVVRGDGLSKWGVVIHQTNNAIVEDSVAVGVAGAGFTTEDGNEVGNVLRRNLAAFTGASGVAQSQTQGDMDRGCPGCEGAGFWFRGVGNTIEFNESWNNAQGMNFVLHVQGPANTRPFTLTAAMKTPVSVRGNLVAANRTNGFEYWGMPRFPAYDTVAVHNGLTQVAILGPPGNIGYLVNLTAIAALDRSVCIEGNVGYTVSLEVDGGQLRGCHTGASESGLAVEYATFRDVLMQNVTNIRSGASPYALTLERVEHRPLRDLPRRYIDFGTDPRLRTKDAQTAMYLWNYQRGSSHRIIDWQGTGKNYHLYLPEQASSTPAWTASGAPFFNLVPVSGLTMGQAWDTYGMGLRGGVVADAPLSPPLEGLINGLAEDDDSPFRFLLGVPRAVLTRPNLLSTMAVNGSVVPFTFALTGQTTAPRMACFTIDGQSIDYFYWPIGCHGTTQYNQFGDDLSVDVPAALVATGTHTVVSWRPQSPSNSTPVSGSLLTFTIGTGAPPPPPPPPPAEVCGDGLDNDGDGQVDEDCAPPPPPPPPLSTALIADNRDYPFDAAFTATAWQWGVYGCSGCYGQDESYKVAGTGAATATWTIPVTPGQTYQVFTTWKRGNSRATNVPVTVFDGSAVVSTTTLNQRQFPAGPTISGVVFQLIGTVTSVNGSIRVRMTDATDGPIGVDAVAVTTP